MTIRTGGVVVFPRLVASEHARSTYGEAVTSGILELDAMLQGGPQRGTSTLLIGPAGAGKSTVALQPRGCGRAARGADPSCTKLTSKSARSCTARPRSISTSNRSLKQGLVRGGTTRSGQENPPGEFAHRVIL